MDILVVEDNFLVGEMIRLAVEDADLDVVGPVATIEEGMRRAETPMLGGALLDINLGGGYCFPLARLLKTKGVPIIFISGYDRSVLPQDMRDTQLISKPVLASELTRIARDRFATEQGASGSNTFRLRRVEMIRQRVAAAERRLATQRRRVEKLQFEGYDPNALQLASDLFEQMSAALQIMRQVESSLSKGSGLSEHIILPISDAVIDAKDPKSIDHWASELRITPSRLRGLVDEVGPSSRLIAKALGQETMLGPSRRATAID
jgi:DNA-binding response OmpR family regulator